MIEIAFGIVLAFLIIKHMKWFLIAAFWLVIIAGLLLRSFMEMHNLTLF